MTEKPNKSALKIGALAKLLELTERRVQQLAKAGVIPAPGADGYALVGSVQGYIRFLKDDQANVSKTAAGIRRDQLRGDDLALRIEERSGALIDEARREALAIIDVFAGGLRADLDAVPAQLSDDLALRRKAADLIGSAFAAAGKRAAVEADRPNAPARKKGRHR